MMNFRDIDYILAAARLKTFSAAANYCHVSQPSLSVQIKNVEDWLGDKIFIRGRGGLTLTPFGVTILPILQDVQNQLVMVQSLSTQNHKKIKSQFLLGAIPTVAPYLLPRLMKQWRTTMAEVEIILHEAITEDLLRSLQKGLLDGAILSLSSPQMHESIKNFISYPMVEDDLLLAVKKNSPLLADSATAEGLLNRHGDKLILLNNEHCLAGEATIICRQQTSNNNYFRATSLETVRHLIVVDDRMTLIPKMAQNENDDLCYLPFDPRHKRDIGLVVPKNSTKKKIAEQIAAI